MQSHSKVNKTILFGLILSAFSTACIAQSVNLQDDLILIESVSEQKLHLPEKRSFIFKNQPKTFGNCNPVSLLYGGTLFVYQNFISQHFSADCLYDPSCSDFSKKAVKQFGLIKGGLLTVDRLGRCNRIAATDLNPGMMNKKTHRFNDPISRYQ
jgi:putative membrane protein insertion efficiency factor